MAFGEELHLALTRLVGTWRTQGRIIGGGSEDGQTWDGIDIYQWFPGGQLMVHRVDVVMAGTRQESIELFTPREESADAFDQTSFADDGSVEHAVGSFDADGRYHNDLEEVRATLTFTGPDSMRTLWEKQVEGRWTDWMDVTFTRLGDPDIVIRSRDQTRK